jgi:diaminopimelate decarboxylase
VPAALTATLAAAIERCERPCLVFDLARIDANLAAIASAAAAAGVTALFAAKSFPDPVVRAIAATRLAGFDVASATEVREVAAVCGAARAGSAGHLLSIADPSGRAIAAAAGWRGRLVVSCETLAQIEAAPGHAEIAIRLSASITATDPAIGAVQDGTGHRRSRFGLDVDPAGQRAQLRALADAAGSRPARRARPIGLHVHHGPVSAASADRFIATARAALAAAHAAGVAPQFLNLGGAWHAIADLPRALAAIRAALPASLEILIEPGRLVSEGAGFAASRIAVARELDDRALRVLELSRSCHLRWSQPQLIAPPPRPGCGHPALFVGPTCYEDDVIGEWTIEPARFPAGAQAILGNITGYALAWNTGFGGVAPADVVMID